MWLLYSGENVYVSTYTYPWSDIWNLPAPVKVYKFFKMKYKFFYAHAYIL